jgi:hypothetical protein
MFLINTFDETLELQVEKYNNGKASVYIEAVTADGYDLSVELSTEAKCAMITNLYEGVYPDSGFNYLRNMVNKCRNINKDSRLDSMLGELDSIISEISDFAGNYEGCA